MNAPLKALIFDSLYDSYKGVIVFFRVMEGTVKKGTRIHIDFQTDESGKWENQMSFSANELGSAVLPFTTPRCRFLRIRIRGKGKGKVYLISRTVETGSELNVRP